MSQKSSRPEKKLGISTTEDPSDLSVESLLSTEDTIIFQKEFRLAWRNGEEKDGKAYGMPQRSRATSYVWLHEW